MAITLPLRGRGWQLAGTREEDEDDQGAELRVRKGECSAMPMYSAPLLSVQTSSSQRVV